LWENAVFEAEEDGIMVIDCPTNEHTDFVFSSYYDISDPNNVSKCNPGYPARYDMDFTHESAKNMIYAPASFRTLAQGLVEGDYCYRYDGVGGQSWAVPYVVYWHLVGR
jgi:hypothetical protein